MNKKPKIIIPKGVYPKPFEMNAATTLLNYFNCDIEFLEPVKDAKTPDYKIHGRIWELKSPIGDGKNNIEHQINNAVKQSCNVIIDARRSKMHELKIKSGVRLQAELNKKVKRLILIDKSGKVHIIK